MGQWAGAMLKPATGYSATLTFYVSGDGTNFHVLTNADGDVTLAVVADEWINMPDEVYAAHYVAMLGDTAGTVAVMAKS